MEQTDFIKLGEIVGHHGIRGWLKVQSYTRPANQILEYSKWVCIFHSGVRESIKVTASRVQPKAKGLVVQIMGLENREQSARLIGCSVGIVSSQLEKLPDGEYYWRDLIGLTVLDVKGFELGTVKAMQETGANDVILVERAADETTQSKTKNGDVEFLIPWIPGVVKRIALDEKIMTVDWDVEY